MKNFFFVILIVVAVVLLWAIRTGSYADGLVFTLGLVAAALAGFLVADHFQGSGKEGLVNSLNLAQKENQALRERAELLQTQFNTAKPSAKTEELEQRIALLNTEKSQLETTSRTQTDEIALIKGQLESLQKNHSKLLEDATVAAEAANTEVLSIRDERSRMKLTIKDLIDENTELRERNVALIEELEAKEMKIDLDTEGVIDRIVAEKTEEEMASEGSEMADTALLPSDRSFVITELDAPEEEEGDAEDVYGTSDNLEAIEGIGAKLDAVLKQAGITNWEKLSMTTPERLQAILDEHDDQFAAIDPTSWPEQARLLVHREFAKFKKYKESIG